MSTDFILPDIGEGIVECEIVEWLVAEGDKVEEDQVVVEVMTDKAVVEIPAKSDGTVTRLYYAKGDTAKVGEPLFAISEKEGASSVQNDNAQAESKPIPKAPADSSPEEVTNVTSAGGVGADFILPDIGEGIVECEIVEWHVTEGDSVKEDQVIVEVMTDKAVVEIPAKADGVISKMYHSKGDIAKVGEPLFALQVEGSASASASAHSSDLQAAGSQASKSASASGGAVTTQSESAETAVQGKALASPAVRRRAREANINIADVPGSGAKGRVLKADIDSYVKGTPDKNSASALPPSVVSGTTRTEPLKGVRAAMARQMTDSVRTIPHFTYAEEFDLTELRILHGRLKARYAEQGVKLTLMPFFIKALSLALKQYPIMNAQLNEDASEITYFDDHNIGMAVATKIGLMVPNIKHVQRLTLLEVAEEVNRLTSTARDGKVAQADMKGGTITISNIGVVGGTVTTPIINKPEAAIVALGKVQALPRFDSQGNVTARDIMTASWSGDHRIIDGATVANFNNLWKSYLEDPASMLVAMA